eukprot:COSAG06_NODE_601_length_13893_cov_8.766928_2_plen_61_part_00
MAPIALASGAKLRACQVRTAVAQIHGQRRENDFIPADARGTESIPSSEGGCQASMCEVGL